MKEMVLTIKTDNEFIKKVDYLKKANGCKSRVDAIVKIIEDKYEDDKPSDCPSCVHCENDYCTVFKFHLDGEDHFCTCFKDEGASK